MRKTPDLIKGWTSKKFGQENATRCCAVAVDGIKPEQTKRRIEFQDALQRVSLGFATTGYTNPALDGPQQLHHCMLDFLICDAARHTDDHFTTCNRTPFGNTLLVLGFEERNQSAL